jgi:hypothetical protein
LTLTEGRLAVKKSRGRCCAIANGPLIAHPAKFHRNQAAGFYAARLFLAKMWTQLSAFAIVPFFLGYLGLRSSLHEQAEAYTIDAEIMGA